jgi:adhesin transport system membrane fusion protein
MLNISNNSIRDKVHKERYVSFRLTSSLRIARLFKRFLLVLTGSSLIVLFLPWTQNVQGNGQITALRPESRPQTLQSPIPGRIQQWFVREGDTVSTGDTLVFIGEVKDEYFDPDQIIRLEEERDAKEQSAKSYAQKVDAQRSQIEALKQNRIVKLKQTRLKIKSDSADVISAEINFQNSYAQYMRADSLFKEGIKSKFDLEQRVSKYQEANAKLVSARNKFDRSLQEISAIQSDFNEKIFKAESELFSAFSAQQASLAEVAKLRNKIANVSARRDFYFIRSPQDALVTKTIITGIAENIKEGQPIVELLPLDYQIAAEIFIRPVDLPLVHIGNEARLEFDGWPAIVFSGWPNTSFGTFPAEVVAVDNVLSKQGGGYRILLVSSDEEDRNWPNELRFGSGVRGIMLLNDVPVWYEIWRQLNGFPPEYYASSDQTDTQKADK